MALGRDKILSVVIATYEYQVESQGTSLAITARRSSGCSPPDRLSEQSGRDADPWIKGWRKRYTHGLAKGSKSSEDKHEHFSFPELLLLFFSQNSLTRVHRGGRLSLDQVPNLSSSAWNMSGFLTSSDFTKRSESSRSAKGRRLEGEEERHLRCRMRWINFSKDPQTD